MTQAAPAANPETRRLLVNCAVMLPTIMHSVDITIATVALPSIQGALSATQDQAAWVLTAYVIAIAIVTPATGWLAGRLGRRRLFLIAVTGFTLTSMLCGAAQSLPELVLFRLFQGGFGAGLIPLSQAVVLDTYPPREHGRAMAIWGIGVMAGPIIGPTLGGYLTEFYSWRAVFYINLPIGILALLGILAFVPDTARDHSRALDLFGFGALAISIACLQMVLDRGERLDWFDDPKIVIGCALAIVGFYFYVAHSLTHHRPFLDPKLFRDRNFIAGLMLGFSAHVCLYSTVALLPPFLQNLLEYPVLTSGFLFIPRAIGTLIGMAIVSRLAGKVDPRVLILVGLLIAAYGLWQMTGFTLEVEPHEIVVSGLLLGIGLGLIFVPVSTTAFSSLPRALRTEGAGIYAVVRSLGASLGISVFVTLFVRNAQANRSALVENVTPYNNLFRAPYLPPQWSLGHSESLSSLSRVVDRQAEMIAYVWDFQVLMFLTLAVIPLVFLITPPKKAAKSEPPAVQE
ncbi:MAG: DHA2 family efflux MFS transporter permease subunit [Alphaproteobacteria bacterium]|nr:DHA2 family efflux MFS transporter permease subunit [Alphaproteobacteria bacterium]